MISGKNGKRNHVLQWIGLASLCLLFFLACDKENPKTELQSSEVNNVKIDHKLSDTKVHHNFFFMQDLNKSFDNFNKPLIIASPLHEDTSSFN